MGTHLPRIIVDTMDVREVLILHLGGLLLMQLPLELIQIWMLELCEVLTRLLVVRMATSNLTRMR